MTEEPFNWVLERSKCSMEAVFDRLKIGVQGDVETRQKLRESGEFGFEIGFSFVSTANKFSASARTFNDARSVTFMLRDNRIVLTDQKGKELLSAAVTFTDDKECKLVVDGQELEEWQFRKRALESIFFNGDIWAEE